MLFSTYVENSTPANFLVVVALLLEIRLLFFEIAGPKEKFSPCSNGLKAIKGFMGGAGGLICGFFGAGGMMMLICAYINAQP